MSLQTREAQRGGGRVRWREQGTGTPVLFVPGLGLSGRFYERNAEAIAAAGFRLLVPDMPGLGGTRGRHTGLDVEENARFLLDFIDLLGLERVHWIGHSIGAQHALRAAAMAPARARSLCLAGPSGGQERRAARIVHQTVGLAREAVRAGPRVVAAVLRDYVRISPLAYTGTWLRAAHDRPITHACAVECPVLLVVGTKDHVVERTFVERFARTVPGARIAWLDGGGHALPRNRTAGFNAAIVTFLRAVDDGAGSQTPSA